MIRFKVIKYKLIANALNKPLSLDEVKAWLKITGISEDDLLNYLIDSATLAFEKCSGLDLINKTWRGYLDQFPCSNSIYSCDYFQNSGSEICIELRKARVSSVVQIQYLKEGSLVTWVSTDYFLLNSEWFGKICLQEDKEYPTDEDCRKQAVEITFISGFGPDETFVPADIKKALLSHIAFSYKNRGDCDGVSNIPIQFTSTCNSYKLWSV